MSDTWILPRQLHTLAFALDMQALSLDLNEQSQICAQSLFVRSKPLPLRTWLRKWSRDNWSQHLSGRILKPSLGNRFATEWASSLAATHASPLARQESDKERTTRDISGRTSQGEFGFSNQGSASLRTSKDISRWGCPTSSKTWQEWVTERRGAYSARLKSARLTNGSECSSWPSPVASEVRQGFQDRSRGMKGSQESLTTVVIKSWPTPNAADPRQGGSTQGARKSPNLSIAVHGPAVPASSNTHGSHPVSSTSRLNARWVETLMGLPVGWTMPSCASPVTIEPTSCDSSETVSSPQPPS